MRDSGCGLRVADTASVDPADIHVHDPSADSPLGAFALSQLADPVTNDRTAIGVFRDVDRPSYNELFGAQLAAAEDADADLDALIAGKDTWTVA